MPQETLAYSNYVIRETKQSMVDPDAKISVEAGMKCPRCKTSLSVMDHGEKQRCGSCGLQMQLWGNGLECNY